MKTTYHKLFTAFLLLIFTSCLKQDQGQYIPGVNGPKVNIQNGQILLTIELENVNTDAGLTLPIPKMNYSTLTVSPSIGDNGLGQGTLLRVSFDLRDVESDKFRVVPEETLPDGRPFPFLISGTLPALAINVPKFHDTTFYASKKVFGFFLPIKLPEDFQFDVHYKIKINGNSYGIVSLIHPNEHGEGAGVVVLLTLDEIRNNPGFKKLMSISKKKKNTIF